MRQRRVWLAPQAHDQVRVIDGWWREQRPNAPDLFAAELASGLATLAAAPKAGSPYPHALRGIRRLHLRSTRYHVYYRLKGEDIVVVAVWSSVRGSGPDLAGPDRV